MHSPKMPADPMLRELLDISHTGDVEWVTELAKRPHLLRLVPEYLAEVQIPAKARPVVLNLAMKDVTKQAIVDIVRRYNDVGVTASKVLAAASVIGIVTEDRDIYLSRSPSDQRLPRANTRAELVRVARTWFHKDVGHRAFIERYESDCLTTLVGAIVDFFNNPENAEDLVLQLDREGILKVDLERPRQHSQSIRAIDQRIAYVMRPAYDQEFVRRLDRGDRIIPLVGEAGNGKSRLADHLIETHLQPGQVRVDIRANDLTVLHRQLTNALSLLGKPLPADPTTAQLINAFANFLLSAAAPAFVLIDNLEDPEIFDGLILPNARPIVLTTSREQVVPLDRAEPLPVYSMLPGESAELVHRLVSDLPVEDTALLTNTLGHRPLAIQHVCSGLLADGFMTVAQFWAEFSDSAADIMEDASSPVEATFTWIYDRILTRLRILDAKNRSCMADLLALVSFVAPFDIPTELLRDAFLSRDASRSLSKFQAAQRELRARYLIMYDGTEFSIHPLTQSILASLLHRRNEAAGTCRQLFASVERRFGRQVITEFVVDRELEVWIDHALAILVGMASADVFDAELWYESDLACILAVLARAARQFASLDSFEIIGWITSNTYIFSPRNDVLTRRLSWIRELHFELAHYLFDRDLISPEYYDYRICVLLTTRLDDPVHAALTFHHLLRSVESCIHLGVHQDVLDKIVSSNIGKIGSVAQIAQLRRIEGDCHIGLGSHEYAQRCLMEAYNLYAEMGTQILGIRGRMQVVRSLVNLAMMYPSYRPQNFALAKSVEPLVESILADLPSRAYLDSWQIRWCGNAILEIMCKQIIEDRVDPNEYGGLFDKFIKLQGDIVYLLADTGLPLDTDEQIYEDWLVPFIHFSFLDEISGEDSGYPSFADILEREHRLRNKRCWRGRYAGVTAQSKLNLILALMDDRLNDISGPSFLETHAWYVAWNTESIYWYCEAQILHCVTRALRGDNFASLLRSLRVDLQSIGRRDRIDVLDQALKCIPSEPFEAGKILARLLPF